MKDARELLELLAALLLIPWAPVLALTWVGAPWQPVAVSLGWAIVWTVWVSIVRDTEMKR